MMEAVALTRPRAVMVFLAFAFAYFISALLRAVTATLAPVFSTELSLRGADLGLLAGAYFLGFSLMQLPLGQALDRHGPRRVLLGLLVVAIGGCVAFATANGLMSLFLARAAIGVGVSACLMAPLTCYRRIYAPGAQMRANSWMLMTGSLGMMASTVPVQWLMPLVGWRGLFWGLAVLLLVAAIAIHALAPVDRPWEATAASSGGYREILRHPMFVRMAPMGFFMYGGLIAVQALWAGPWLTRVAGRSDSEAAAGLLLVNASMLVTFLGGGELTARSRRRTVDGLGLACGLGCLGQHRCSRSGGRCMGLGRLVRLLQRCDTQSAGDRAGLSAVFRGSGAIRVQSRDLRRCLLGPVGHWMGYGPAGHPRVRYCPGDAVCIRWVRRL
jgi:predicted MFS family arabinose efflux permease